MKHDDKLTCPHCGEKFDKGDASWTVCLTCGKIAPPGESLVGHGPGPGADTDISAECCTSLNVYTADAADEKQAEVRERKREEYVAAGRDIPWEDDDGT